MLLLQAMALSTGNSANSICEIEGIHSPFVRHPLIECMAVCFWSLESSEHFILHNEEQINA